MTTNKKKSKSRRAAATSSFASSSSSSSSLTASRAEPRPETSFHGGTHYRSSSLAPPRKRQKNAPNAAVVLTPLSPSNRGNVQNVSRTTTLPAAGQLKPPAAPASNPAPTANRRPGCSPETIQKSRSIDCLQEMPKAVLLMPKRATHPVIREEVLKGSRKIFALADSASAIRNGLFREALLAIQDDDKLKNAF